MKKLTKRISKGIFALGTCGLMLAGLISFMPQTVKAEISEDGMWELTFDEDGNAGIMYVNAYPETDIVIPSVVDGYEIKNIINITDYITSVVIPDTVTYIDGYAFGMCSGLTSIEVDENNQYYASYDGILYNKDMTEIVEIPQAMKEIVLADSVKSVINLDLSVCTGMTSITISSGVTNIDVNFSNFSYLTKIEVDEDNKYYASYDGALYNKDMTELLAVPTTKTSIKLPDTLTTIKANAFNNCSHLTSVELPDGVTSIGEYSFYNCESLTSVNIPDGVTSIGECAFYNCMNLASINIPDGVTSIENETFYNCKTLTSIELPDSVISIGERAFFNCAGLDSITIPENVTSIGEWVFSGCLNLTEIEVNSNNKNYSSKDGILYNKDMTTLIKCPYGKTSVEIPDSVTAIEAHAFNNCKKITAVTIPDSVTELGEYAFSSCVKLTDLVISKSLTSIGMDAFAGCENLENVEIPEGITNIGQSMFSYCDNLSNIVMPNTLTSIGNYAFSECEKLTAISIPASVTSIGDCLFGYNEDGEEIKTTIYGYAGSYAETYAADNGHEFIALKELISAGDTNASISNTVESLLNAVLTEEEIEEVKNGATVEIELKVNEITSDADDADKYIVEEALPSGYEIKNYFDITLNSIINDTSKKITETSSTIEIVLDIPLETKGTYQVIRIHNGVADVLPTTIKDGKLVFSTDKFSTYAIIYNPTSGDVDAGSNGMIIFVAALAMLSAAAGAVFFKKRKIVRE